jgi:hypothetical protein
LLDIGGIAPDQPGKTGIILTPLVDQPLQSGARISFRHVALPCIPENWPWLEHIRNTGAGEGAKRAHLFTAWSEPVGASCSQSKAPPPRSEGRAAPFDVARGVAQDRFRQAQGERVE